MDKFKELEYVGYIFNNVTGHLACKMTPFCMKRTFEKLKTINDTDLRFTEEEFSYLDS